MSDSEQVAQLCKEFADKPCPESVSGEEYRRIIIFDPNKDRPEIMWIDSSKEWVTKLFFPEVDFITGHGLEGIFGAGHGSDRVGMVLGADIHLPYRSVTYSTNFGFGHHFHRYMHKLIPYIANTIPQSSRSPRSSGSS